MNSRAVLLFVCGYLSPLFGWGQTASTTSNFVVFADAGIPGPPADLFTWSESGCSPSFNGKFADPTAPEGTESFRTAGPACDWLGWGIFKRLNMSLFAQGQIRFWLKSSRSLRFELEGPKNRKAGLDIPSTGNEWQEIVVPIGSLSGTVDLAQIYGLFLITSTDGAATFFVDHVRWLTAPVTNAPITVRTNGLCPPAAESVLSLEINRPHTLRAPAIPGYAFLNWTDGSGQIQTNDPVLSFIVQSNLVLAANYLDNSRPVLTVAVPRSVGRLTNAETRILGTVKDIGCVRRVAYQLNSDLWREASGTTNWHADLILAPGTNWVQFYAEDSIGNRSGTNVVMFYYAARSVLSLSTNGSGRIDKMFSGNSLEIGRRYTVKAVPSADFVFSGWTGGYRSTNATLTFVMTSNLMLIANFVPNPFRLLQGDYHGLFSPTNLAATTANSGRFSLRLSDRGKFSGVLQVSGRRLSFSSTFDATGRAQVMMKRPQASSLLMSLELVAEDKSVEGWVTDGVWSSPLTGIQAGISNAFAGKFTLLIGGSSNGTSSPPGYGACSAVVDTGGGVKVRGALADGLVVSQGTVTSSEGQWPLFVASSNGRELLMGWMKFGTSAPVLWLKDPTPNDKLYPAGFSEIRTALVAPYTVLSPNGNALGWTNGTAAFRSGGITGRVAVAVQVVNDQFRGSGQNVGDLVLRISKADGTYTGSFVHPITRAKTQFKGAIVQDPTGQYPIGSGGWFLGTNQGGAVLLDSTPPIHPEVSYKLNGLNFSPYLEGQDPSFGAFISIDQIRRRMRILQPYTEWIRTYGCTHGLENAGIVARELNLKVALGAWLSRDLVANELEITNLIRIAREGHADLAIVGSETLLRGDLTAAQLVQYVNRVKQALPEIPVTTADTDTAFQANRDVMQAVDVLLVNYYPFWDGVVISNAVAALHYRHTEMLRAVQGKAIVVSETGWPSDGEPFSRAIPSPVNARQYLLNFVSWARANHVSYFYFAGFDETWKAAHEGARGAHWGLWDKDGHLKAGNQAVFDGELLVDNWTTASLPGGFGAPSIEFTHVPPYGSFENLEGQILHVRPADYKIAVYIYVSGWWTKPTFASPLTALQFDGSFVCDVTTGGIDQYATAFAAYLLPMGYAPPAAGGAGSLSADLDRVAAAKLVVNRGR